MSYSSQTVAIDLLPKFLTITLAGIFLEVARMGSYEPLAICNLKQRFVAG